MALILSLLSLLLIIRGTLVSCFSILLCFSHKIRRRFANSFNCLSILILLWLNLYWKLKIKIKLFFSLIIKFSIFLIELLRHGCLDKSQPLLFNSRFLDMAVEINSKIIINQFDSFKKDKQMKSNCKMLSESAPKWFFKPILNLVSEVLIKEIASETTCHHMEETNFMHSGVDNIVIQDEIIA